MKQKGVMNMTKIDIAAVYHEAKSRYAYAYDKDTLHLRLRTAKNDVDNVKVIYGDPFNWGPKSKDDKTDTEYVWKYESTEHLNMVKEYETDLHDYWFIAIKPKYRRTKYVFILEKGDEQLLYGCRYIVDISKNKEKVLDLFNYFNFPFINPIDVYKAPEWVKETIWYQIYPERFANGNKENDPKDVLEWGSIENVKNNMFFGGDLEGVIEKLDYLANLGINGIYFTPIFTSPSSHKYDIINYFEIDPQFGDIQVLKTLVKEAHKRGIRVMLDAVFNHCSFYHPFFQDVLKYGEKSTYKDYFHIKKFPVFAGNPKDFHFDDDKNVLNYDTFAFTPFMPKWNTEHPKVKEYLLDVARFWITECDIDAWRLDVSNEVDHAFWRAFRKVCDETKPDFFIVGENWDDSYAWLQPDQMHSVMNYEFMFPVWSFFGHRSLKATEFKYKINKLLCLYPKNIGEYLFNLLDSHDTTRILNICQGNKQIMKLAYVFQMTFGGTPVVYYGDEIGLAGGHDPDNRRCMIWDENLQDLDMFKHIQKLISLRKTYPLMRELDIKWVDTNDNTNHLMYKKQTKDGTLYVVINNQNQPLNLMKEELVGDFYDVYNDKIITIKSNYIVNPYGFLILKKLCKNKE